MIDATGVSATPKAKEIDDLLTKQSGYNRVESVKSNTCAHCGGPAREFRNEISVKEYTISGLCQQCQDSVFGED